MPEWEELRDLASRIKEHTLTHLDHYLEQFETNAKVGMSALGTTLAHPAVFHAAESAGGSALEHLPRFLLYNPLNP